MKWIWRIGATIVILTSVSAGVLFLLSRTPAPETVTYGLSFNTPYARELGLDWKETYDAILDDLGVRHLRLAAHWNMVQPAVDSYNFSELDYQLLRAEEVGADVVFAVGRRLPRWPECHIPEWAAQRTWEEQKTALREYITTTINRYKDSPAITYWQVENEPYLEVFATEYCGALDENFLKEEIALVRELDPSRPILVTDSGNLGLWAGAYRNGDAFGTSVYVYFWNPDVGPFRTVMPAWLYRVKDTVMALRYGEKESILIELSAEPWLVEPITDVPVDTQLARMNEEKIRDILEYAAETHFSKQYLWGAEWWYWMITQGHPELWSLGKEIYSNR